MLNLIQIRLTKMFIQLNETKMLNKCYYEMNTPHEMNKPQFVEHTTQNVLKLTAKKGIAIIPIVWMRVRGNRSFQTRFQLK